MTLLDIFAFLPRIIDAIMKRLYPQQSDSPSVPFNHVDASVSPSAPPMTPLSTITATPVSSPPSAPSVLLWDTPQHAFHSTRVMCDEMGLSVEQKNEFCATVYGESEFKNGAVCINRDINGKETSRDVGLCQWNSYWHCGAGKTFPSVEYVVAHPEDAIRKMIEFYKTGHINLWVAHKSGRYKQFLETNSPMWKLQS